MPNRTFPIFPTAYLVLHNPQNIGRKIFTENFSIAKSPILRWYQQVITKGSLVLFIRIISPMFTTGLQPLS